MNMIASVGFTELDFSVTESLAVRVWTGSDTVDSKLRREVVQ